MTSWLARADPGGTENGKRCLFGLIPDSGPPDAPLGVGRAFGTLRGAATEPSGISQYAGPGRQARCCWSWSRGSFCSAKPHRSSMSMCTARRTCVGRPHLVSRSHSGSFELWISTWAMTKASGSVPDAPPPQCAPNELGIRCEFFRPALRSAAPSAALVGCCSAAAAAVSPRRSL